MNRLIGILSVALALAVGGSRAQCPPPETLGPCECHVDANGLPALVCRNVAGWQEVGDVINNGLPHLSSMDIVASPGVTDLPSLAFADTLIDAIRFYDTGLLYLNKNTFSDVTAAALKSLYVKHNSEFYSLENDVAAHLPALEALYVSYNKLGSLSGAMAEAAVPYIDLSHNGIKSISADYFASCTALKVLLLPFNELTTSDLGPGSLTINGDPDDLYVDLAWNSLTEGVQPSAFGGRPPKELLLSHNGIATLSESVFGQLLTDMEAAYGSEAYILLDHNQLTCGCDMAWIVNHSGRSLLQQAECEDGRLVSGLTVVDFDHC
ncbi:uncharacterized protein LOC134762617 [Penaeus indicus]|uniref:uncharacterized protein LOC134762617 n=1 Tax=Penaeus indicus TaxID=29960 RepID=UPI00300D42E4